MRIAVTTAVALLTAMPAFAQDDAARRVATEVAARVPLEKAAKGVPYSAETVIESSQALADGNKITSKTTGRVYRDGEGRTRREDDRKNGTVGISITDPVGGFSYSLDPVNKIAWRTPMGVGGSIMRKVEEAQVSSERRVYAESKDANGRPVVGFVSTPQSEEEKQRVEAAAAARGAGGGGGGGAIARGGGAGGGGRGGAVPSVAAGGGGVMMRARNGAPETPLEHKVIDGVAVEGRSTKSVIPAGQVGNEQPITILDEQWRSSDLNVLVMTRHVDPRSGESSYKLLNIVRAEPDPSLFIVPPDYTVKDTGVRRMIQQ